MICCLVRKSRLTLLWPQELKPARLLSLWNFPGKNTGVGCHSLLWGNSQPRVQIHVSCIGRRTFFLTTWATWETPLNEWSCLTGVKLVHLCRHPRLLTSLFQTGGPKVAAPNSLNTKDPIISLPLSTWNKTNEHVIILERTKECYCTLAKRNPWCTTTISCGTLDMGKDWTSKPQGLGMWTDSKQNGELQLPPSSPCDIWGWIAKKWGIVD